MKQETKPQRTYKDSVFRMLLNEPKNALSVYNGLNDSNYTDPGQLTYNTLDNAVFMNVKNDVSFIIGWDMMLYEHQSTFTPNMPLRDLFYIADLLHAHVKDETLYSHRLVTVPTPGFFVFYNGKENFPDKKILRLSEAYEHPVSNPQLELIVTMLNINPGHNEELKKKCPILQEYSIFVDTTRKYSKNMPIEEAVKKAVDNCIENDILRDFLLRQKAEVIKMSIYEFDAEREWALIRRDERILALEELRQDPKFRAQYAEELRPQLTEELRPQLTEELRIQLTEELRPQLTEELRPQLTEELRIQLTNELRQKAEEKLSSLASNLITLCQECGKSKTETIEKLQKQCSLSESEATNYIDLYWQE